MYGHDALGPRAIFQVTDSQEHKELRKAVGGAPWGVGLIKKNWESKVLGVESNGVPYVQAS